MALVVDASIALAWGCPTKLAPTRTPFSLSLNMTVSASPIYGRER
jgi:hypothetical protein